MHFAFGRIRRKTSPAKVLTYGLFEDEHSACGGEVAGGKRIEI